MSEPDQPQVYLIAPPVFGPDTPDLVARLLDAHPVACLRLALATQDIDQLARAADALREVAHSRDVPIVVSDHLLLVAAHGLDGVHLSGTRGLRDARKELGADAIVGAFCAASRHDGITAAEIGADYVSFGPAGETALGAGSRAELELYAWWSEVIEAPVVAEGALDLSLARTLAPVVDFLALGEEVFAAPDPVLALGAYLDALRGA